MKRKGLGKLWRDNRGFTFVELLSSALIFSFFSIALLTYMNTAASLQGQVNSAVGLETTAQTAMGVIEEYIVEAAAAVWFDDSDDTIYIVNNKSYGDSGSSNTGDFSYTVHAFRWTESTGEVHYMTSTSAVGTSTDFGKTSVVENTTFYRHIKEGTSGSNDIGKLYKKVVTTTRVEDEITGATAVSEVTETFYYNQEFDLSLSADTDLFYGDESDLTEANWGTIADIPNEPKSYLTDSTGNVYEVINYEVEMKSYASDSYVKFTGLSLDASSSELLSKNVTDFYLDCGTEVVDGKVQQVEFTFEISNTRDSYSKTNYVVVRNKPPVCIAW